MLFFVVVVELVFVVFVPFVRTSSLQVLALAPQGAVERPKWRTLPCFMLVLFFVSFFGWFVGCCVCFVFCRFEVLKAVLL